MIRNSILRRIFSLTVVVLLIPVTFYSKPVPPQSSAINVTGSIAPDTIKKGRSVHASIVMDIPSGLHVQSNRPLDKFLVATKLDVETPAGLKVSPISYPRPVQKRLKFSKSMVAVYEGKATIRFSISVPVGYAGGSGEIRGKLRFQACNDESCFPPVTREVKMWLNIE